jgi:hypothetical protein
MRTRLSVEPLETHHNKRGNPDLWVLQEAPFANSISPVTILSIMRNIGLTAPLSLANLQWKGFGEIA